jgi:hypothetical protein
MTDNDGLTDYVYDALNRLDAVIYLAIPGGPPAATTLPESLRLHREQLGQPLLTSVATLSTHTLTSHMHPKGL